MVDAGPNPVERCRPFSVGDAMIFVAAAAVGMAIVKATGMVAMLRANLFVVLANSVVLAFSMPLTVAWLVVRLRRPRPPLRRVWWQPGMLAAEAMAVTFGLAMLVELAQPKGFGITVWVVTPLMPLPVAWSALALSGRWRREPGWIDRLGVAIGAGWCLETLALLGLYFR